MKSSGWKYILAAAIALSSAAGANAADNTAPASPALGVLSTATSAELPAKAAELVTKANPKNLKETTIDVVKAAVGLNPAAAPAIVGSIAQASPAMAATASATAVALVPNQALAIARAAAAACPAKAGAIVEAICRVLPSEYQKVAVAVADVVPGAGKEILAGISSAIPVLKDAINQTLASYQGSVPSVSAVLNKVAETTSSTAVVAAVSETTSATASASSANAMVLPQGPSVGAPPVPVSGTPTVITPESGGVIPTGGGRGYSAP